MEQLAVILDRRPFERCTTRRENVAIADEAEISSWAKNSVQVWLRPGLQSLMKNELPPKPMSPLHLFSCCE